MYTHMYTYTVMFVSVVFIVVTFTCIPSLSHPFRTLCHAPSRKGNVSESGNAPVAKQDLHFNLKVKVTIHEVTDLQSSYEGKTLFCVFDVSVGVAGLNSLGSCTLTPAGGR